MRPATRQIEGATAVRILTHGYFPWVVDTFCVRVLAGEGSVSMVTSTDVLEAFTAERPIREQLREMVETEHLELYRERATRVGPERFTD